MFSCCFVLFHLLLSSCSYKMTRDIKLALGLLAINATLLLFLAAKCDKEGKENANSNIRNSSVKTTYSPGSSIPRFEIAPIQLKNESQPYAEWYGNNILPNSEEQQSIIEVIASNYEDVVVFVRYDNPYKNIAGHIYIRAGESGKIYVYPGKSYLVYFYSGNNWDSTKKMDNGIRGGFTKDEYTAMDPESHYFAITRNGNEVKWDGGITYNLNKVLKGNLRTKGILKEDAILQY